VLDKINASLILLLFKPFVKFDIAYSPPPLGDICILSHVPLLVVLSEVRAEETSLCGVGLLGVPSVLAGRAPTV
jgi:hypothetical protein